LKDILFKAFIYFQKDYQLEGHLFPNFPTAPLDFLLVVVHLMVLLELLMVEFLAFL
jgi:hypothetical protein